LAPERLAPSGSVDVAPGPRPRTARPGASGRWTRVVVALAVLGGALLLNDLYIFESVVIPSSSMEPAILPTERIFLSRFPRRAVHRFDVVVIKSPRFRERIAKRVIALPGERVRLENSWRAFINDTSLSYSDEDATHQRTEAGDHVIRLVRTPNGPFATQFGRNDLQLGADEYFVLGDNRLASDDSRAIGPVRREDIEGPLGTVWYSYDIERHRLRTERLLQTVR
jgi:signal peptidase I